MATRREWRRVALLGLEEQLHRMAESARTTIGIRAKERERLVAVYTELAEEFARRAGKKPGNA